MNIQKVCNEIAKELGEEYDLVHDIVMYLFKFTTDVMKDSNDYHDILFHKLFRFKLKNRFKEDKTKDYSPHEKNSN